VGTIALCSILGPGEANVLMNDAGIAKEARTCWRSV
jgi:hypothetical protein